MNGTLFEKKDFWAGLLYAALGAAALWIGRDYTIGTAARMGAGYFPRVLAVVLLGIGALSILRAVRTQGLRIEALSLKPVALVTGATLLFGYLLDRAGLIVALAVLILVSAAGSRNFKLDLRASLGTAAFIAICALVFVKALGVPMPLIGSWFGD